MKKNNIIWQDNSRILWKIPWLDNYELCDEKLIIESGLFIRERNVVMLYRILDVQIKQTIIERLNNVGSVILYTNDKTNPTLTLKNIKNPIEVMDLIIDLVEVARDKKGIKISEFSKSPNIF